MRGQCGFDVGTVLVRMPGGDLRQAPHPAVPGGQVGGAEPATSTLMASPLRRKCSVASYLLTALASRACWALRASTTLLSTSTDWPATNWLIQPAMYSYACAT